MSIPEVVLMLKKNESMIDRMIRIIIGIIILLIGYLYSSWWGLIGLLPLLTGIIGFCPLYALLGWNTCCNRKRCVCREEEPVKKPMKRKRR